MKENQKRLAIIDDGVYGAGLPEGVRITHLKVCGGKVTEDSEPSMKPTHGALCAAVILRVCPKIPIISIKIMEQDTAGDIRHLCTALEWCLAQRIPLVHMSLGILVYGLKDKLENAIKGLIAGGTLVVAAFHNRNIPTWPASFPGVFGVRADRGGILLNREFAFDTGFPGNRENGIIARMDESLGDGMEDIRYANSFAAPVVTARLAEMTLAEEDVTFGKALAALEREAAPYPEGAFEGMYCRFRGKRIAETEIPLLWVERELLGSLFRAFEKDGYDVAVFSDCGVGAPLGIYGQTGGMEEGFTRIMAEIYPKDALLFSTGVRPELPFSEIDMYVAGEAGEVRAAVETGDRVFESVWEVFLFIKQYFSSGSQEGRHVRD